MLVVNPFFLSRHSVSHANSIFCVGRRYGFDEIKMGVGLNTLAVEGSYEKGFLSIFEEKFTADVSVRLTPRDETASPLAKQSPCNNSIECDTRFIAATTRPLGGRSGAQRLPVCLLPSE